MEFSGLFFLYLVLPVTIGVYYLIPDVARRNVVLIAASLMLYGMCQPGYVVLLLFLCRLNFKLALRIKRGKFATAMLPLAVDFAALFLLKYVDPLLLMIDVGTETSGLLLGLVGKAMASLSAMGLSLQAPSTLAPLGMSFYTLTTVSYIMDIYRGRHPAERSYQSFLLHMVMFPKLFQGPLVRYEQTVSELKERRHNYRHIFDGAVRFATGLGKKVLLADYCGRMLAELALTKSDQALVGSWLGAVLFFFQIYYDFSGCCDMAVGLGKIFGFRFPENFRQPYMALSVEEFCQRWNMTLGNFFRDYVYDPLCKGREGLLPRFAALVLSCVLAGLWHGGSFGFLLWGLFLAAAILIEKALEGLLVDLPYWLRHTLVFLALLFGWVIFRNPDVESLGNVLKAMIGNGGFRVEGDGTRILNCVPLIAACWIGATELPRKFRFRWRSICGMGTRGKSEGAQLMQLGYLLSCFVYVVLIFWWCTVSRTGNAVQPSIFMYL